MKAGEYVYILLVAGGIQVMPVRSVGQCVQLGVGVGRDCARLGRPGTVGGGPALSMIANVRCCRAIVRVMSIWLWGSGAGGVGVWVLCVSKGESMTMVAMR
jgi:hypothetical protein